MEPPPHQLKAEHRPRELLRRETRGPGARRLCLRPPEPRPGRGGPRGGPQTAGTDPLTPTLPAALPATVTRLTHSLNSRATCSGLTPAGSPPEGPRPTFHGRPLPVKDRQGGKRPAWLLFSIPAAEDPPSTRSDVAVSLKTKSKQPASSHGCCFPRLWALGSGLGAGPAVGVTRCQPQGWRAPLHAGLECRAGPPGAGGSSRAPLGAGRGWGGWGDPAAPAADCRPQQQEWWGWVEGRARPPTLGRSPEQEGAWGQGQETEFKAHGERRRRGPWPPPAQRGPPLSE